MQARHPAANVTQSPGWCGFNQRNSHVPLLQASDPLFKQIGAALVKVQQEEYVRHLWPWLVRRMARPYAPIASGVGSIRYHVWWNPTRYHVWWSLPVLCVVVPSGTPCGGLFQYPVWWGPISYHVVRGPIRCQTCYICSCLAIKIQLNGLNI